MKSHYSVLGVDKGSDREEVRAAWQQKARELHPDRNLETSDVAAFAEASLAWAVLGDEKRRLAYDKELALLTSACAACKGEGRTWKQKGIKARVATTCAGCEGSGRTERRKK